MLVAAAYELARLLRVPWLGRRFARGAVILCYHNVVSGPDGASRDSALHMSVQRFEAQMVWLSRHFEVVSLDTLLQRLAGGEPTRRLVAITFDDGYTGYFQSALPILRALSLPSAVFVVSEAAEHGSPFWWDHPALVQRANPELRQRWLTQAQGIASFIYQMEQVRGPDDVPHELRPATWETVRRHLGPDVTVGSHTGTHPALPTLGPDGLREELARSADQIHRHLGIRPRWLAYPYGAWTKPVREAARTEGYHAALTLDVGRVHAGVDLLALPRVNIPGRITAAGFEAWASGLFPPRWLRR